MSAPIDRLRLSGDDRPDPVGDALVHGLLVALAAAERRDASPPVGRIGGRRLRPRLAVAVLLLCAGVCALMLGWPTPATAETVMSMAVAHSSSQGTRVYRFTLDPAGDGIGRRPIEGRVFLEAGRNPRMAAEFRVGPLQRSVRFGNADGTPWIRTPSGVQHGSEGAPLVAGLLAGLDDRLLRMDAILARCGSAHVLTLLPSRDGDWVVRAVRRAGSADAIVEAEFEVRTSDGAVTEAWLAIETLAGPSAELTLRLEDGVVATEADFAP
jgi:hypothetical protein